jgi:hypothetical protein
MLLQAPQATVAGTVRDGETGAPLAGAVVALADLGRVTTVQPDGGYAFTDVPPGPQHLAIRFIGYAPRLVHALVPRVGRLEINVTLRAEPLRLETIEVRPNLATRGLEEDGTAYPDRSVSIAAVRNHPMLAEPDALEALGGGEVVLSPESPSGMNVRGGAADQTGYLLDDIPVLSPYHSAGLFTAWNPDALAALTLSSSSPWSATGSALSGTVLAETRAPSSQLHAQGSLSTTQARLTVDGPLGPTGAGFLASFRHGLPGGLAAESDPSYLHGENGDWLTKLETGALGGSLRLLAYDNDNELSAASVADAERASGTPPRNRFAWESRSFGGSWERPIRGATVRLLGWSATTASDASWLGQTGALAAASQRRDLGLLAAIARRSERAHTEIGLRLERSRTSYRVTGDSVGVPWRLYAETPVATAFAQRAQRLGALDLELGAGASMAASRVRLDPGVRIGWRMSGRTTLTGSFLRRHQFAQSLRNPESVIGNVFPADLFIGSGAPGVPVARSDQAVIAAEVRPAPGIRLGAQAYARALDGLVLAAPRGGEPFATGGFAVRSGQARGASLEAAASGRRYAVLASYGYQWIRLGSGDSGYVPANGTAHLLDAGILYYPAATLSVRLGVSGAVGRRGTATIGAVEWESCNLRDRGCELAGSPQTDTTALGRARLPSYLRLDLGVRKHWHFEIGGRDAVVAVFGTLSNVLARTNVLTYVRDPATGAQTAIQMRPRAPLVIGLDWQF